MLLACTPFRRAPGTQENESYGHGRAQREREREGEGRSRIDAGGWDRAGRAVGREPIDFFLSPSDESVTGGGGGAWHRNGQCKSPAPTTPSHHVVTLRNQRSHETFTYVRVRCSTESLADVALFAWTPDIQLFELVAGKRDSLGSRTSCEVTLWMEGSPSFLGEMMMISVPHWVDFFEFRITFGGVKERIYRKEGRFGLGQVGRIQISSKLKSVYSERNPMPNSNK